MNTQNSPEFIVWHIQNVKQKIEDYFFYQNLYRTINEFIPDAYKR